MKYLLPYKQIDGKQIDGYEYRKYVRFTLGETYSRNYVFNIHDTDNTWLSTAHLHYFSCKETAMKALDNSLISRGYFLIPEDQVERFTKKLSLLL